MRLNVRAAPGFTIMELMVVVAIVAVLASFALPAMKDMVTINRMKTLSLDIYTSLTLARSEAIKRNTSNVSMVAASGGWQNGWTVCVDTNSDGSCGSGEPVLVQGEAPDSTITFTGPAGNIVTYTRDGRVGSAAAFRITHGANNAKVPMRCVDVTTSGRPATKMDTNGSDADGCN